MVSTAKNNVFNKAGKIVLLFLVYVLITLILFNNKIPFFFTHYGMPDVDTDGGLWFQWYLTYIKNRGVPYDLLDIVGFPVGYDIAFSPIINLIYSIQASLMSIFGFSWQLLILLTNVSSLIVYPLSATGAFCLSYYLTKDKLASFISGIVFGFSYYFVYMGRGQMSINHIELIPVYLLSLFYYLDSKRGYALAFSVALFSILFKTDAYYAFFSGILSTVILLFYKQDSLKNIIKRLALYYSALFLVLVATNINFFYSNLYIFDKTEVVKTGRNSLPKNELLSISAYFNTAPSSLASSLLSRFSVVLGIIPILFTFISFFITNNKKVIAISAVGLSVCVILTTYSPIFYWVNQIYFDYFGMFRGVSRMIMPAYIFIGLMSGLAVSSIYKSERIKLIHPKLPLAVVVFYIAVFLFASIVKDPTWYRKTDFFAIAELYRPIKQNENIRAIAAYPMKLGSGSYGFPMTYELLGQIIHNKKLASGVSPFSPELKSYFSKINNIVDPNTIPNVTKYGVDTIILYNNLLDNSKIINASLSSDLRLSFVGRYESVKELGYSSSLELSKDISVYQINEVVNRNKTSHPLIYTEDSSSRIEYRKITPYKYLLTVVSDKNDERIVFNYPFSDKWQLIAGDYSKTPDYLIKVKNIDIQQNHSRYLEYANAWDVNIPDSSDKSHYTLLFKPHGQYEIGDLIGYSVFMLLGLYILLCIFRKK